MRPEADFGVVSLRNGDCIQLMSSIPDNSIDMVLADLPYGTTACKWDSIIPFDIMWEHFSRIAKTNAAIVLTASQPFTSALVMSQADAFKYQWVWEKSKASNFLLAKKQPLKAHEDVLVFSFGTPAYYPQMLSGKPFKGEGRSKKGSNWDGVNTVPNSTFRRDNTGTRYPRSVQYFATAESEKIGALHPTQKPVALMDFLIRSHSQRGDTIFDPTMGSGTTGVAALQAERKFIGFERDNGYFQVAQSRIAKCIKVTLP